VTSAPPPDRAAQTEQPPAGPPEAQPLQAETPSVLRRRVFSLAWPVIGENMLETSLDIVNTVLVAGLGTAAVAGVGSGLQIMFFVLAALSALSVGSSILVAQAVGARDVVRASQLARQSMLWSVLLSLPLAVLGFWLAGPIIGIFGVDADVAQIGTDYLRVAMGTVVVLVALLIGGGVLRGAGDSRTPMLVTLVANIVNVGLAYALIYGHFGLPALGAVGSAWAAFVSRGLALALLLRALWRGHNGVSIAGPGGWRPNWGVASKVLRLGIPSALEQVLLSTGFLVLTIQVAQLGTATLAAQRIAIAALSFSFLPGIGFGLAATALVGQSIGARRPDSAASVGRIATTWAVLWMSGFGALIFLAATPIMRLFSTDPEVIAIGAGGLRVMALTQPFWAVRMAGSGALRGTGDTRFPMLIGSLGIWAAVAIVWVMLHTIGGSLAAVWGAFLVTAPVTALLTWRRFQGRLRGSLDTVGRA
jgi:MATE family multidrug resistance protein